MVLKLEHGEFVKAQMAGPCPRSFWFCKVRGMGMGNGEQGEFKKNCTDLTVPTLSLTGPARRAKITTSPGVPRAQTAESRALPLHAVPLPQRLDVSPAAPQLWQEEPTGGVRGGRRRRRPWTGPASARKRSRVRGEREREAAARPAQGTMLNMWKVRELVDKA